MFDSLRARWNQRRALNAYTLGDYARAERLFRAQLAREGETQGALRNLGLVRMAQGELAEAETWFARELELYGPSPDRLRALAEVAYLAGDRDRAAARLAAALAHPDLAEMPLLVRRAAICAEPAAYAKALEGKRHFAEGNARLAARDIAAALAAFRRAAEADPTDFAALNNMGGILLNAHHDPAGAARAFERALELQDLLMVRKNLARARTLAKGGRS